MSGPMRSSVRRVVGGAGLACAVAIVGPLSGCQGAAPRVSLQGAEQRGPAGG